MGGTRGDGPGPETDLVSAYRKQHPAAPARYFARAGVEKAATLALAVVDSKPWNAMLVVGTLYLSFGKEISWVLLIGPGDRPHYPGLQTLCDVIVMALVFVSSTCYHLSCLVKYRIPIQRRFLRRMAIAEFFVNLTALGVVVSSAGQVNFTQAPPLAPSVPNTSWTEVLPSSGFIIRFCPFGGISALPFLLISVMMLRRSKMLDMFGTDVLSPMILQASFTLSIMATTCGALLIFTGFCMLASRYPEVESTLFAPVMWWIGEMEASLEFLYHQTRGETLPSDPARFAALVEKAVADMAAANTSVELKYASANGNQWVSPDLADGLVGKVVRLKPRGVHANSEEEYLFSIDKIFSVQCRWDTYVTLAALVTFLAFYVSVKTSTRALVISPLESTLDAIRQAAEAIGGKDRSGASGTLQRGPIPIGDAVTKILQYIGGGVEPAAGFRSPHDLALPSEGPGLKGGRPGETRSSYEKQYASVRGSSIMGEFSMSENPLTSDAGSDGGEAIMEADERREGPSRGRLSGRSSQAGNLGEDETKRALRMTFHPRLLNGMGTPAWPSYSMQREDLLPITNLLFVKMRIPASLCARETFVAWSRIVFERHSRLPFHCPNHTVGTLHAILCLTRPAQFNVLGFTRRLALMIATMGAGAAAMGLTDQELADARHPLTRQYWQHPQANAAMAIVLEAAEEPGADVFEMLEKGEREDLVGLVASCVHASLYNRNLVRDLKLEASIQQVTRAQNRATMSISDRVTPVDPKAETAGFVSKNPGLAMRTIAALSQLYHGWSSESEFALWEDAAVLQDATTRGLLAPSEGSRSGKSATAVKRRAFWEEKLALFQVLGQEISTFADLASLVDANLNIKDARAARPRAVGPTAFDHGIHDEMENSSVPSLTELA